MSATSALPTRQLPENSFGLRHGEFEIYMNVVIKEEFIPVLPGITFLNSSIGNVFHIEKGMILQVHCGFQFTIGNRSFCLDPDSVDRIFYLVEGIVLWSNPRIKTN